MLAAQDSAIPTFAPSQPRARPQRYLALRAQRGQSCPGGSGTPRPGPGSGALAPPHGALLHSGRPHPGPPEDETRGEPSVAAGNGSSSAASFTGYRSQAQAGCGLGAGPSRPWAGGEANGSSGAQAGRGARWPWGLRVRGEHRGAPTATGASWMSAFVVGKGSCAQAPAPGAKAGWLPGVCAAVQVLPVKGTRSFLGRAKSFPRAPKR